MVFYSPYIYIIKVSNVILHEVFLYSVSPTFCKRERRTCVFGFFFAVCRWESRDGKRLNDFLEGTEPGSGQPRFDPGLWKTNPMAFPLDPFAWVYK